MLSMYPNPIQSSVNGSLDIFTGIFYMVRIFGIGQGAIQQSSISSPNGGYYLEQDIFSDSCYPTDEALWFFEESTTAKFYQLGLKSQPTARFSWTSGDNETDNYPLELRNLTEVSEDIFEDPSSTFWGLEPYNLTQYYGYEGTGYKIKPLSFHNRAATFASNPKSPNGWWLQIDKEEKDHELDEVDALRQTADYLFVFKPQNFKLYAEIAHMDIGEYKELLKIRRSKKYLTSYRIVSNPNSYDIEQNVTIQAYVQYNLYVKVDEEFDIFSGITVISPETTPSRKYFDFESQQSPTDDGTLNLKANKLVRSTEEIELEPFSKKNISAYVTYLTEFQGIRYFSYADVTAVVDMMGDNGEVLKNVLVKDVALLKHLIRSRGYQGDIKEVAGGDCAKVQIKTRGTVRGYLPIPFIQFEETELPTYVRPDQSEQKEHLS